MPSTSLTYEVFLTLGTQIKSSVNSRPMPPMSSEPKDLEPLTTGHFLIGSSPTALPDIFESAKLAREINLFNKCDNSVGEDGQRNISIRCKLVRSGTIPKKHPWVMSSNSWQGTTAILYTVPWPELWISIVAMMMWRYSQDKDKKWSFHKTYRLTQVLSPMSFLFTISFLAQTQLVIASLIPFTNHTYPNRNPPFISLTIN